MNKTYEIFIQYADKMDRKLGNQRGFAFEVQAKGILLSIEAACKEMKEAYPYFVEGVDFTIIEIKQK
jgi:hypothetical protein